MKNPTIEYCIEVHYSNGDKVIRIVHDSKLYFQHLEMYMHLIANTNEIKYLETSRNIVEDER